MWRYGFLALFLVSLALGIERGIEKAYAAVAAAEDARRFVDDVGQKVLGVLNGGAPQAEKQNQLRTLFSEHVDIDWMGKFVLGRAWQQANEDQRSRYLSAYREYLLGRYTTNFADYAGSHYTITGVISESAEQFTVGMQVKSPKAQDQDTEAGYRVKAEGGQFKIVDIIIEGVSLITTQRSEFSAVVQKDGMDKLIEQIKAKTHSQSENLFHHLEGGFYADHYLSNHERPASA